jgi:hypothetical protein
VTLLIDYLLESCEMKRDTSANVMDEAKTVLNKKPYHRPELQVFGKLHLLTRGVGTANGDAGQNMMVPSDRAIKDDIVRIGTHPLGIGVYLFDYKSEYRERCGDGRQVGVMADEVEAVLPEAVSVHPDGYKMVDYAMLRPRPAFQ